MSYSKTLFSRRGVIKKENDIKDENETSYFYVQGVR